MSQRKTHVLGTNNRTFCGNKINNETLILDPKKPNYKTDCGRCLSNLTNGCTFTQDLIVKVNKLESYYDNIQHLLKGESWGHLERYIKKFRL